MINNPEICTVVIPGKFRDGKTEQAGETFSVKAERTFGAIFSSIICLEFKVLRKQILII